MEKQLRSIITTMRAAGEEGDRRVTGLGVIYDTWAELWPGFKERINRGAVILADGVKSFFNHNPNQVLSTVASDPPLTLEETDAGLLYTSPIPPTSYGRDLEVNLDRGNVRGASFAFSVPRNGERMWEDENGTLHREIKELVLYEIGPVTEPAYIMTTAALRSVEQAVQEWRKTQVPVRRLLAERRQRLAEIL